MDDILRQIERTYGSLEDPKYFGITDRMRSRPYDSLIEEIGREFEVEDTTDTNTDVGFIYALTRQARSWALALSAVGPYAILARGLGTSEAWGEILTPASPDLTPDETWLIRKVGDAGVRLLTREELEYPIPLHILGSDPATVRVYQAAFSNADILPWDTDTLRRLGLID